MVPFRFYISFYWLLSLYSPPDDPRVFLRKRGHPITGNSFIIINCTKNFIFMPRGCLSIMIDIPFLLKEENLSRCITKFSAVNIKTNVW